MKRVLIILMMLLLIVACSNSVNIPFDDDVNNGETETNKQETTIDIWDVDPVYEYDDIDVDFINDNNAINYYFHYPYYSTESPYMRNEKGSFIFIKNNKFGYANSKGEIIHNPRFRAIFHYRGFDNQLSTQLEQNNSDAPFLNDDFSLDIPSNTGFAPIGGGAGGWTGFGYKKDGYAVEYLYGYDDAISDWRVLEENKVDIIDVAKSKYGINDIQTVLLVSDIDDDSYIKGFVAINRDNSFVIENDKDYSYYDFSDDVVTLAKLEKYAIDDDYSEYLYEYLEGYGVTGFRYPIQRDKIITHVAYYDTNANLIGEYDNGYGFYEGYAPVKKNGKWGYIDKQNNVVIDFIFDKATPLCDGKAWVIYNGRTGRLNIKDMLDNNVPFNDETLKYETNDKTKDEILEVIDPYGTYVPKDSKIACVVIPNLRQRTKPNGDIITNGYNSEAAYCAPGCAKELDIFEDNEYKWIKIGDNRWIGTKPDWIIETKVEEYKTNYSLNEREVYKETREKITLFPQTKEALKFFPMSEEERKISEFLKLTVPGLYVNDDYVTPFDARNPSVETLKRLYVQIHIAGLEHLYKVAKNVYPTDSVIPQYTSLKSQGDNNYFAPGILQEHLDFYTNKYYGNVLDFRICADLEGSNVFYDAKNQWYDLYLPTGIGGGQEEVYPFVLSYNEKGEYTEVIFSATKLYLDIVDNIAIINKNYELLKGEEAIDYIKTKAKRFIANIKRTEDNNYQLITVDYYD